MLPSSGYFKSVLCPFYNNGLCERPHCHYKHAKRDAAGYHGSRRSSLEEAALGACGNDSNKAELLAMVNMAIKKVQEDINRAQEMAKTSDFSAIQDSSPTYIPTPVGRCPSQHGNKLITDLDTTKPTVIPEYKPTPIAQLRKLKHQSSLEDTLYKPVLPPTKKRKRVEEYDPTEVKCVYKKLSVESTCNAAKIKVNHDNKESVLSVHNQVVDLELDGDIDDGVTPCFSEDSDTEMAVDKALLISQDKENVATESKLSFNKDDSGKLLSNSVNIVDKILDESRRSDEKIKMFKHEELQQKKKEMQVIKEEGPQNEEVKTKVEEIQNKGIQVKVEEDMLKKEQLKVEGTQKKVQQKKEEALYRDDELKIKEEEQHRKEVEPHRKEVEPHSKEVEPHSKDVEHHSKEVEPHRKEVEPHRKEVEPHRKETDPHRKEAELHRREEDHRKGERQHRKEERQQKKEVLQKKYEGQQKRLESLETKEDRQHKKKKEAYLKKHEGQHRKEEKQQKKYEGQHKLEVKKINQKKEELHYKKEKVKLKEKNHRQDNIHHKKVKAVEEKRERQFPSVNYPSKVKDVENKPNFKKSTSSSSESHSNVQKHISKINKSEKTASLNINKEKCTKHDKLPKQNINKSVKKEKLYFKEKIKEKINSESLKQKEFHSTLKVSTSVLSDSLHFIESLKKNQKLAVDNIKFKDKKDKRVEKSPKIHADGKSEKLNSSHKSIGNKPCKSKEIDQKIKSPSSSMNKKNKIDSEKKFHSPASKEKSIKSLETYVGSSKHSSNSRIYADSSDSTQDERYKNFKCISPSSSSDDDVNSIIDVDTDLDEHDTFEECWRIFNETPVLPSVKDDPSLNKVRKLQEQEIVEQELTMGKKRIAHQPDLVRPQPKIAISRQMSPGEAMHNRLQKFHQMYTEQCEKRVPSAFLNAINHLDSGKKRIAHVPNASMLAEVAQKQRAINQSIAEGKQASQSSHIMMTQPKGVKRIAHNPSTMFTRPTIPVEYGSRVATNIRQRYLNLFIDECLKFYPSEKEAFEAALEEEKNAYSRSTTRTVYLNVAINTLKRLRDKARDGPFIDEQQDLPPTTPSTSTPSLVAKPSVKTVSHQYVLGGPMALKASFSIEKNRFKSKDEELKGSKLYSLLKTYILSEENLIEHGFPRSHPTELGKAVISGIYKKKYPTTNNPLEKICCRCQKKYKVSISGKYVRPEECVYHWGRLLKRRVARTFESRYSCCQVESQSEGCCLAPGHVHEGDESDNLCGFVKTLPKSPPFDGNYGVYALDCEMCYTTKGIELARITVINPRLKSVYETLVNPENTVLDHNTRFSGITEDDLAGVTTNLRDVQAVLLNMFNDKTILIGHSLESDLKALRLIHNTVVDTSVVFPHKMGLPYKRALRTLMAEHLNKIIQNNVDGHDSQEDAVACMELMLWKIKEDLKRRTR